MGLRTIYVDLGKQGKGDAEVFLAKSADVRIRARFLLAELVAGKAQHDQTLVVKFAVQRFQALVLRREAAGAGRIDDQQHLALVSRQVDRRAVQRLGLESVDAGHVRAVPVWRCPFAGAVPAPLRP